MQNASAVHTPAWVNKTSNEAQQEFATWKSARQKEWQKDYLDH